MKLLTNKPEEHLIEEIKELRQRITELELSKTELQQAVNEKENIIATLSSGEDITERKRIERALCESEELYRKFFQQSVEAIYMFDPETKHIVGENDAFLDLLGYKKEETITLTLYDFVVHKKENIDAYIHHILTSGAIIIGERIWRRKDKTMIDVWVTASKIKQKGKDFCFVVAHDVTERKHAEEALRKSEERYRTLVENINLGITLIDSDYKIIMTNAAQGRLFSKPASEFVGKECYREFEKREAVCTHCPGTKAMTTGQPAYVETEGVRDDGSHFLVGIHAFPLVGLGGETTGFIEVVEDITEQKRAEKALRESEGKLNAMLHAISDYMIMIDKDLNIIWENENVIKIFGNDIIGKKCYKVFHNRKAPCEPYPCQALKVFQDGKIHEHDFQVVDKDGKVMYVHCTANVALRDKSGKPIAVLEVTRDITKQKQAEEALRESEKKYRAIFENTGTATVIDEEDTTICLVNAEFEKLSGYSKEEIEYKKSWTEFIAKDDLDRLKEYHNLRRFDPNITPKSYEFKFVDREGNVKDILANVHLIPETKRSVASLLDITERKQAEMSLKESEERLRSLSDAAFEGIVFHMGGILLRANNQFFKIFGYEQDELVGKQIVRKLVAPEAQEFMKKQIAGDKINPYESIGVRKDGTKFPMEIRGRTTELRGQKIRVATILDITERKQAEEELLAAKKRLETLTKSSLKTLENERCYIARELHDEIGQELTALTIHLENMQYLPNSTVYMNNINETLNIVQHLIQKVRNLSFDLRPPILDDLGLVPALRWYLKRLDKEAGLTIHFIDNFSDHRLSVDIETACFRIVQEALTNVVRHAKARQATIELQRKEKELQLTVSDDGIGFYVKSAQKHALLGESFGLLGMQERVALVGGTIEIESMLSRGTKVIAFFPL